MRKEKKYERKITRQLIIVFVVSILISFILFISLIFNQLSQISQSIVQTQLQNIIESYESDWSNGEVISPNFSSDTYYIQGEITNTTPKDFSTREITLISCSDNIGDKLDTNSSIEDLINFLDISPGNSRDVNQSVKKIMSENMFCAYASSNLENDSFYFLILMRPLSSANATRRTIALKMVLSFTVAMLFSIVILITWSTNHVKRISNLEHHISNLPQTNYKEEYLDQGSDELAHLSSAIENMRLEILNNEQTKQEMLQNISHDIKTPISVIKSYAEAMQDGHSLETGPNVIIKQADILYNKTKQLISYNKLSYLAKDKDYEDVNMKRLIESVVTNLSISHEEINVDLDLEPVIFKGYSDNYVVVIENILENAFRYAKSVIKITLREDLITIYNDGEPIEDKFINDGFKAYEKGSKGQFGLGMSIVVKTLDFFDYSLNVKNEDVGVTFTIAKKELKKLN